MTFQEIPEEQPCVGRFNSWSKCSRKCGRGEQFRTFNIIQKSGSGGRKCIFENGEIDKKECFNDKFSRLPVILLLLVKIIYFFIYFRKYYSY